MPEQEQPHPDPIAAPRISCIEVTPGYLSATFGCQHPACSSTAATVELIAKGTPHADDQFLQRELLEGDVIGGVGQIILKGFLRDSNYSMPLSPTDYQQVAAVLRSCNLATPYALKQDYA